MMNTLQDKESIVAWLEKYKIKNYTLVEGLDYGITVDVDGDVAIANRKLTHIPVKFGKVNGNFFCGDNKLNSLEGCPTSVGGYFYCSFNQLTSLQNCPVFVGENFYCSNNNIDNLDYLPNDVVDFFYCENNPLASKYQETKNFAEIKAMVTSDREKALLSASLRATNIAKNILKV